MDLEIGRCLPGPLKGCPVWKPRPVVWGSPARTPRQEGPGIPRTGILFRTEPEPVWWICLHYMRDMRRCSDSDVGSVFGFVLVPSWMCRERVVPTLEFQQSILANRGKECFTSHGPFKTFQNI